MTDSKWKEIVEAINDVQARLDGVKADVAAQRPALAKIRVLSLKRSTERLEATLVQDRKPTTD